MALPHDLVMEDDAPDDDPWGSSMTATGTPGAPGTAPTLIIVWALDDPPGGLGKDRDDRLGMGDGRALEQPAVDLVDLAPGMAEHAVDGDQGGRRQAGGPEVAIIMGGRQAGLDPGDPLGRAVQVGPDILGSSGAGPADSGKEGLERPGVVLPQAGRGGRQPGPSVPCGVSAPVGPTG